MIKRYMTRFATLFATATAVLLSIPAHAIDLDLSQTPLFLRPSVAPLNMLVVGRDHKLYYEAYNDYTDLNDDKILDLKYKPATITYYGYFDSLKCYTYNSTSLRFDPVRLAGTNKTCGQANEWSGDFLNYLTTARIDALRKVLYGGLRSVDSATETVLERTFLPQDAHSWGKEYESESIDGYDIRLYAPLPLPAANTRHLFANTTLLNTTEPLLRVLTSRSERIWNWVSIERPVAGSRMFNGGSGAVISPAPTDYSVRVAVCVANATLREPNCQPYPGGGYKPIGLLQEFGQNDAMYFGLITGSYAKNTSGGVLRRRMDSIAKEINANGTFKTAAADAGIIASLNRMRVTGFGGNYEYGCGWITTGPIGDGNCQMWGNPIAEMMYESLRYYAGKGSATSEFAVAFGAGEEEDLPGGGMPVADWNDPYAVNDGYPACAKPFQTVVSDINPSYDTDQLPGSAFGGLSGAGVLTGLDVAALGQTIWNTEFGGAKNIFIGDNSVVNDGAPSPKTVSSFGNIRGLSPEEPTKRGGYYSASVAYHGRVTDISGADGVQNVKTFSVALASPLPKISIPLANGRNVTLVPFAKSVHGADISATKGDFQPTDQIVDFYVDSLTSTSGKFRVNFEDVEQGADHDMDAITVYEYSVSGNDVTVKLTSEYAYGGITQHMGYVISGTTHDGIYLDVLDQRDGDDGTDTDYFLDTPQAFTGTPPAPETGTGRWRDGNAALPFDSTRTFTGGTSTGATLLPDPLWYAAKWGGFNDTNNNRLPDQKIEWDTDTSGLGVGIPDNYFLVTNALKLSEQLRQAFQDIMDEAASASSASVNSGSISTDTRVYQAKFNTLNWTGELIAYGIDRSTGLLKSTPAWESKNKQTAFASRQIITVNSDTLDTDGVKVEGAPVPFLWASLDATRRAQLSATEATQKDYVEYLRGNGAREGTTPGSLRVRGDIKMGDIVSSSPNYVGAPRSRYPDDMESKPYSDFVRDNRDRNPMVYVGANDGMLHGFDAGGSIPDGPDADTEPDGEEAAGGREVFAFIPKSVFANLKQLPEQNYSHRYYVDGSPNSGDVFFGDDWHTVLVGGLNLGGQGIYALDVTNPATLATAQANPGSIHLWEFTDQDDRDLGYTYSQPAIVRMHDGKWAAVFGNGYNNTVNDAASGGQVSATGNAVLYVVDIATGNLIRKFDTKVGMNDPRSGGKPNGLATPVMVDVDGDRIVDHAYAGDLLGNLWKFDLRDSNHDNWKFAFGSADAPEPLFSATDQNETEDGRRAQPITVRPEVARGPYGVGVMVLFGTGKFLELSDKTVPPDSTELNNFYGLFDPNTYTDDDKIVRSRLVHQTITSQTSVPDPDGTGPKQARSIRTTSTLARSGSGFYLDLYYSGTGYKGERQVTDPLVRGDRVIFTTLIPNSRPCDFGGSSWLMVLDLLSGKRLTESQLDTDGDGDIDSEDTSSSGVGSDNEILSRPESLLCLGAECDRDRLLSSGSSGDLTEEALRSIGGIQGRQSWRQIK